MGVQKGADIVAHIDFESEIGLSVFAHTQADADRILKTIAVPIKSMRSIYFAGGDGSMLLRHISEPGTRRHHTDIEMTYAGRTSLSAFGETIKWVPCPPPSFAFQAVFPPSTTLPPSNYWFIGVRRDGKVIAAIDHARSIGLLVRSESQAEAERILKAIAVPSASGALPGTPNHYFQLVSTQQGIALLRQYGEDITWIEETEPNFEFQAVCPDPSPAPG